MSRLIIFFKKTNLKLLENDIVISDFYLSESKKITHIHIDSFLNIEDKVLIEKVKTLFKTLDDDARHYINNFYDCSISVLIQYLLAIDFAKKNYDFDHILIPNRIYLKTKTCNYFLSEWESAGIYLYQRENVFTYFVEQYIKTLTISVKYQGFKISFQWINNVVRIFVVFFVRLYYDLKNSNLLSKSINRRLNKNIPDYIFIIRSQLQYNFIKNIIHNNDRKYLIIIGDSMGNNFLENIQESENIEVINFKKINSFLVIKKYLETIFKLVNRKKYNFTHKNILFNFKQAIREIAIMIPGLKMYELKLKLILKNLSINRPIILFTLEQKSPHASVECEVARLFGITPIQLMTVDQSHRMIPNPIYGDKFIVDFKLREDILSKTYETNKIKYIYPVQFLNLKIDSKKLRYKICYFTNYTAYEENKKIILFIKSYATKNNVLCAVRLHPRDNNKYSDLIGENLQIISKKTSDYQLFNSIETAITPPSSVILHFLPYKVNLIYIDYFDTKKSAFIKEYKPRVQSIEEIEFWIENPLELKRETEILSRKIFGEIKPMNSSKFLSDVELLIAK